jgi:16S rRNA processing protein RimM
MTDKSELVFVAAIAGSHGVRGECKVKSFTQNEADAFGYGPFYDEDGQVLLTPVKHRSAKNLWVASFKEQMTREQAQALKGTRLYVPRSALPALEEEEFYHAELIGLKAQSLDGSPMGEIKDVHNYGSGDLLELTGTPERDDGWLLPFTLAFVPHVSVKDGVVTIDPPEDVGSKEEEEGGAS